MGVYRLSQNHIALHYISVSYHMYHGTYGIFRTYHRLMGYVFSDLQMYLLVMSVIIS